MNKKNHIKIYTTIFLVCLLVLFSMFIFKRYYYGKNITGDFKQNRISFEKNIKEKCNKYTTISLKELTPFLWDKVYFFGAYETKEDIFKTVGVKWSGVSPVYYDDMMQIVFVDKGKVACYIHGDSEVFYLSGGKRMITSEENPRFMVMPTTEEYKNGSDIHLKWYDDNLLKDINRDEKVKVDEKNIGIWKSSKKIIRRNNLIVKSVEFGVSEEGIILGNIHYSEYREKEEKIENLQGAASLNFIGTLNKDSANCKLIANFTYDYGELELKFKDDTFIGNVSLNDCPNLEKLAGKYNFSKDK